MPISENRQMTNSTHLERAIAEGLAEIVGDGRGARIRYADRSERWTDPEEKVRAERKRSPVRSLLREAKQPTRGGDGWVVRLVASR